MALNWNRAVLMSEQGLSRLMRWDSNNGHQSRKPAYKVSDGIADPSRELRCVMCDVARLFFSHFRHMRQSFSAEAHYHLINHISQSLGKNQLL